MGIFSQEEANTNIVGKNKFFVCAASRDPKVKTYKKLHDKFSEALVEYIDMCADPTFCDVLIADNEAGKIIAQYTNGTAVLKN